MKKEVQLSGKVGIGIVILIILGIALRFLTITDSTDAKLNQKVREELWSTYSGLHLGPEINRIKEEQDYDNVDSLLKKASKDAITIEKIDRSEQLLSWSSNQKVIVRVYYRFPEEAKTQVEYMYFEHGALLNTWSFRYNTSALAFYLNYF